MKKWGRSSPEFVMADDERIRENPRYARDGTLITSAVNYYYSLVLEAIAADIASLDLTREESIVIGIQIIDDGKGLVHQAIAHVAVAVQDEE